MARVLLTGGTGYIGGMVARKLQGHTVFNIDRKLEDTGVSMATYNIDLSSPAMPDIVRAIRPDTIMHFAAETEVGKSMEQPGVFYETNVSNTIRLMNVAADVGVKNFIFSSTSSVYGDIPEFPPTEDVNKNPVSPYGISKSCIEDMLPDYERAYGMNYAILRYFNAAGAALDNTHGYKQHKATHIIPILCRKVLNNETLTIFGQNYDTPDGTTQRDYVHVEDLAEAHIKAMEYLQTGGMSGAFNIGSGEPHTILQLVSELEQVLGRTIHYEFGPEREGDPAKVWADNSKALHHLGWEAQYNIADILRTSYEWEKKNQ